MGKVRLFALTFVASCTCLSTPASEIDSATANRMIKNNQDNWKIVIAMKKIDSAHEITQALKEYSEAEYDYVMRALAVTRCESEECKADTETRLFETLPAYTVQLGQMIKTHDRVSAGSIQMPPELRQFWDKFFPADIRADSVSYLNDLTSAYNTYAQQRKTQQPKTTGSSFDKTSASTSRASSTSWSGAHSTPSADRDLKPNYRSEYVNGQKFLVGNLNGTEVWVQLMCRTDGCNKLLAWVLVSNGSNGSIHFIPKSDVKLTVYYGSKRATAITTFSASEWIKKQENKAAWKAFGSGLLVGLANSGPSGTYSGTVNTRNRYGGSSYGSYSGSYTDYDQKAKKIARQTEYYASRIAQAFENSTGNLLYAETLSPGENVVGTVYFEKFPNKLNQAQLTVTAGGKRFEFSYGLR